MSGYSSRSALVVATRNHATWRTAGSRKRDSTDRRTSCARPVMPTCAVCAADEVPWPSSSGEAQAHPYSPMTSFSNMPLQACWLPSPCPSSEYYGASVPFRCRQPAVGLAAAPRWLREEAATSAGPTFTDHRLAGAVSSCTPAASPRGNRSSPRGLAACHHSARQWVGAIIQSAPRTAPAHIHQL
jgi:hypothetical protein